MKHIKLFEQWDDFDLDEFFGKDEVIKERDVVELIDKKNALYSLNRFTNTGTAIGSKLRVGKMKTLLSGETIFLYGDCWYNVKNFKKV